MKKIYITILMFLAIFLNIDGVRADVGGVRGPYEGTCDLIVNSSNICSYKCSISEYDEEYKGKNYINFTYKIEKLYSDIHHSITTQNTVTESEGYSWSILFGPTATEKGKYTVIEEVTKPLNEALLNGEDGFSCLRIIPSVKINEYTEGHTTIVGVYERSFEFNASKNQGDDSVIPSDEFDGCTIFGENLTPLVKWGVGLLRIAVALIFVVMTILDFLKLAGTGEEKNYKDALNKFIKRLIIVVLIEVLPLIISILIDISGILEQYNIQDDIFCSLF